MTWLNIGLYLRLTKIRITPLFFMIDISSVTLMESSRRDLLKGMAEHRSISKDTKISTPLYFYTLYR